MRLIDADAIPEVSWDQKEEAAFRETINKMPTIEAEPVRHGRWIHDGYDFPHGNDWIHCSECGKRGINVPADLTNYCPNCGAKMEEQE